MKELARGGMTMVCVTHETGFAREVAVEPNYLLSMRGRRSTKPRRSSLTPKTSVFESIQSKVLLISDRKAVCRFRKRPLSLLLCWVVGAAYEIAALSLPVRPLRFTTGPGRP